MNDSALFWRECIGGGGRGDCATGPHLSMVTIRHVLSQLAAAVRQYIPVWESVSGEKYIEAGSGTFYNISAASSWTERARPVELPAKARSVNTTRLLAAIDAHPFLCAPSRLRASDREDVIALLSRGGPMREMVSVLHAIQPVDMFAIWAEGSPIQLFNAVSARRLHVMPSLATATKKHPAWEPEAESMPVRGKNTVMPPAHKPPTRPLGASPPPPPSRYVGIYPQLELVEEKEDIPDHRDGYRHDYSHGHGHAVNDEAAAGGMLRSVYGRLAATVAAVTGGSPARPAIVAPDADDDDDHDHSDTADEDDEDEDEDVQEDDEDEDVEEDDGDESALVHPVWVSANPKGGRPVVYHRVGSNCLRNPAELELTPGLVPCKKCVLAHAAHAVPFVAVASPPPPPAPAPAPALAPAPAPAPAPSREPLRRSARHADRRQDPAAPASVVARSPAPAPNQAPALIPASPARAHRYVMVAVSGRGKTYHALDSSCSLRTDMRRVDRADTGALRPCKLCL